MKTVRCIGAAMLLLLAVPATEAGAQSRTGTAVVGGGGGSSGDGAIVMCATFGQPAIGPVTMGGNILQQGFWHGSVKTSSLPWNPAGEAVTGAGMLTAKVWPNPSSGNAELSVNIPSAGPASATLHDVHGTAVRTLFEGIYQPRRLDILLDATDLPSGAYTVVLTSGTQRTMVMFRLVR